MNKGKVKWYNRAKGFGFIKKESGSDIFVHHTALDGKILKDSDEVSFEVGEGPKGECAINVKLIAEMAS